MEKEEKIEELLNKHNHIPYPSVPKLYPNKKYAMMLYDDFAGELGELSAITQYIYEHIQLKQHNLISKTLVRIAIQEMKHLALIGEVIKMLAEEPMYINSNQQPWSSKNVKYDIRDMAKIMDYNIETEKMAIKGYEKILNYTGNKQLRKLWERILLDENTHIEIFKCLK